nr:hypothetical protein CFP56_58142 [Quercus suber]
MIIKAQLGVFENHQAGLPNLRSSTPAEQINPNMFPGLPNIALYSFKERPTRSRWNITRVGRSEIERAISGWRSPELSSAAGIRFEPFHKVQVWICKYPESSPLCNLEVSTLAAFRHQQQRRLLCIDSELQENSVLSIIEQIYHSY